MRADLALRAQQIATASLGLASPGGKTEVVPNLRSALTIAKNLDRNSSEFRRVDIRSDTNFDTRVRYRRSLNAFFDELDGSLWQSPDGLTKRSLRLGFNQVLGAFGGFSPLTITGQAIFETTQDAVDRSFSQTSLPSAPPTTAPMAVPAMAC